MNYEINFLVLQSKTEDLDKLRKKVKRVIENCNGKITDELLYEKRKLSYEIKHETYGFFTVYRFDLEKNKEGEDQIKELKNDLNLTTEIARYIIVRSSELPTLHEEKKPISAKDEPSEKNRVEKEDISEDKKKGPETTDQNEISKKDLERELKKEKKQESKKEEKDDSSLNDLDKKLDEILNI